MIKTKVKTFFFPAIMAFLLTLSFVFLFFCDAQVAHADTSLTEHKSSRKAEILQLYVSAVGGAFDETIEYATTKQLYDFSGNSYTLVECVPTGYLIYSDSAGELVEYSASSPSPYLNIQGDLRYLGPAQYYSLSENILTHTITAEQLTSVDFSYLQSLSCSLNEEMLSIKNENVLNYITKTTNTRTCSINALGYTFTCVNNGQWFYDRSYNFGYFCPANSNGVCGYVAINLLLGYYDTFTNLSCVHPSYMSPKSDGTARYMVGSSLTEEIYALKDRFNLTDSIAGPGAKKLMNGYLGDRGLSQSARYTIFGGFNGKTIKNYIINNERPVILFGSLRSPENGGLVDHAVVVYGYKDGGYGVNNVGLLAHFGWSGYSAVGINCTNYSTYGAIAYLDI